MNHRLIATILVASALVPFSAVALSDSVSLETIDAWVRSGVEAEQEGEIERAAALYLMAASYDPELSRFLRYRAAAALMAMPEPPVERLRRLSDGMVGWGFGGAAHLAVRIETLEGLPTVETLESALKTDDRELICIDLDALLRASIEKGEVPPLEVLNLHHGRCSDTEIESLVAAAESTPTVRSRVQRAERLYGQVRFTATLAELDELGDVAKIDDLQLRCRAMFVRSRAMYRLLKRRRESDPMYAATAAACTEESVRSFRKRSLYALGKRQWDLGDPEAAKPHFEKLYEDFADSTHADDALFFLARIARTSGDRERELELTRRALDRHAEGDMIGELVWETSEPLYRDGKYEEFIALIESLELPARDDQYYSQGRLEYFVANAHRALKREDEAIASWQGAWTKYPWSFYGYLSRMRMVEAGASPAPIEADRDGVPPWMQDVRWRTGGVGRLGATGRPDFAADYAVTIPRRSDAERWRVAWALDRAGAVHVSHNIVRRTISGRPWIEPAAARYVQWSLAWPDPFGELVEAAIAAETAQADDEQLVHPALARSIMREESSFIPDIESYAGALGLMQLMPRTARGHDDDIDGTATPERLKEPEVNVRVGADHLFWLARRFDGHPLLIVAAYNAGSGALGKWLRQYGGDDPALFIEDIPRLQTRDYTKRVIGSYAAYQWLTGEERFDDRVLRPAK